MSGVRVEQILDRLLPLVGTGGVIAAAMLTVFWIWRKDQLNRENHEEGSKTNALLDHIMARLTVVEQQNEKLRHELREANEKISSLRQQIVLLESATHDLPLPMWLKDGKGIVLAVNRAYVEMFLAPRNYTAADYIGQTDFAVWPEGIANKFRENDLEVWRSGRVFNDEEPVEVLPGEVVNYHVIKYIRYAGGQRVGIAGIAIPPISELKKLNL